MATRVPDDEKHLPEPTVTLRIVDEMTQAGAQARTSPAEVHVIHEIPMHPPVWKPFWFIPLLAYSRHPGNRMHMVAKTSHGEAPIDSISVAGALASLELRLEVAAHTR